MFQEIIGTILYLQTNRQKRIHEVESSFIESTLPTLFHCLQLTLSFFQSSFVFIVVDCLSFWKSYQSDRFFFLYGTGNIFFRFFSHCFFFCELIIFGGQNFNSFFVFGSLGLRIEPTIDIKVLSFLRHDPQFRLPTTVNTFLITFVSEILFYWVGNLNLFIFPLSWVEFF